MRLRTALAKWPEELPLMFRGIALIARMVAARYRLSKQSEDELATRLTGVLQEFRTALEIGANHEA